jgi:lipopolysaccharide export system protein LptC
VRSAEEHEQAFSRAAQHSRIVAILRKTLPVMAVVVLASYFISTRLSVTVGGVTASVSGVEVNDGNLRMVNPTLKGMDKKNGAYVVSADYADQDMKNPKMIKLHAIKAELTTDQKGWSRMQAARGLFNSESERLIMQDDIRVSTSSGVTGKLTLASLEMKSQVLRSHQPVAFDLPSGTVRARALKAKDESPLDPINLYNLIRLEDGVSNSAFTQTYSVLRSYTSGHQNTFFNTIDGALNGPNAGRERR